MSYLSKITTKGQITIPGLIRKKLRIKPGDEAFFHAYNPDTKEITIKINVASSVEDLYGSLHIPGMKYESINSVREKLSKKQDDETWI